MGLNILAFYAPIPLDDLISPTASAYARLQINIFEVLLDVAVTRQNVDAGAGVVGGLGEIASHKLDGNRAKSTRVTDKTFIDA